MVLLTSVKGGSNTLSIIPGHASIANQVFVKFVSRLPPARSDLLPPETSRLERMKIALASLADIAGNPKITSRDPLSSLSFSCLPPDVVERQTKALREYRKGLHRAFNPCGPDGRPLRKYESQDILQGRAYLILFSLSRYSDKISAHWFYGGHDGLSIAGVFLSLQNHLFPHSATIDQERRFPPCKIQIVPIKRRPLHRKKVLFSMSRSTDAYGAKRQVPSTRSSSKAQWPPL